MCPALGNVAACIISMCEMFIKVRKRSGHRMILILISQSDCKRKNRAGKEILAISSIIVPFFFLESILVDLSLQSFFFLYSTFSLSTTTLLNS